MLVSRLIQDTLPTVRPIWHPVHRAFFPVDAQRLMDVSYHSFPSDHVAFLAPLTAPFASPSSLVPSRVTLNSGFIREVSDTGRPTSPR